MKNSAYRARRKLSLFKQQGGCCYWCERAVVLAPDATAPLRGKRPPRNLGTIDHLRDRFDPTRTEPNPQSEQRWVLACWECNNKRSKRRVVECAALQRHKSQTGHIHKAIRQTLALQAEARSQ